MSVLGCPAGGERRGPRLEQRADLEHLPRLLHRRMRDLRAAIGLDHDDALMGERLQGGAHDGPARAEGGADLVLGKPRPRRQAMVENRGEQPGIDGAHPLAAERRRGGPAAFRRS